MSGVPSNVLTLLATAPAMARVMGASRHQVLTVLLMAIPVDALDLIRWYRRQIVAGRFSSDPAIVFALFRSLGRKGRIDLATSFCGASLDTRSFVKLMSLVNRKCAPNGPEKDRLAATISLHASVHWNISATPFEKLVRTMLNSRRAPERAHGALCVESLSGVHPDLGLRLAQLVRDPVPYVRCNAWSGAKALAHRGRLPARTREALLLASLALGDEEPEVRRNARLFRRHCSRSTSAFAGRPRTGSAGGAVPAIAGARGFKTAS